MISQLNTMKLLTLFSKNLTKLYGNQPKHNVLILLADQQTQANILVKTDPTMTLV